MKKLILSYIFVLAFSLAANAATTNTLLGATTITNMLNALSNSFASRAILWPRVTAYVQQQPTNGICQIAANYNVSNVIRSASGVYNVTFSTPLSNSLYLVLFGQSGNSTSNMWSIGYSNKATTGFTMLQQNVTNGTPVGVDAVEMSFFVLNGQQGP